MSNHTLNDRNFEGKQGVSAEAKNHVTGSKGQTGGRDIRPPTVGSRPQPLRNVYLIIPARWPKGLS